jgi:hypothetical protein
MTSENREAPTATTERTQRKETTGTTEATRPPIDNAKRPAPLAPSPARTIRPGPPRGPALRFSPTAWAKLVYLRDLGPTEVGGFGIATPEDLLGIEDVRLVRQEATAASVAFDDAAVADYFDQQVDLGLRPAQFARVWLHTHPGRSPAPSGTDEETFARVFGRTDWAVMFILARGGQTYCRLRFNLGPGAELAIPVSVDYSRPFPASDQDAWADQYAANVREEEVYLEPGPLEELYQRSGDPFARRAGAPGDIDDWSILETDFRELEEERHGPVW